MLCSIEGPHPRLWKAVMKNVSGIISFCKSYIDILETIKKEVVIELFCDQMIGKDMLKTLCCKEKQL
jgi:hypothetical protein